MKITKVIFFLSFLLLSITSFAERLDKSSIILLKERLETITLYLNSLQSLDAKTMNSLFDENGMVISTSKGKVEPRKFFNGFFSELKSANLKTSNVYKEIKDDDHYAARFHFSWVEKSGEAGGGNYMDDFTFAKNSNKLLQVFMFENKNS
jgi:hypothetical protein